MCTYLLAISHLVFFLLGCGNEFPAPSCSASYRDECDKLAEVVASLTDGLSNYAKGL